MRTSRIILVALLAMVLAGTALSTVNAASFGSSFMTIEWSSGTVEKYQDASGTPQIHIGADVSWDNAYYNRITYSNYANNAWTCSEITSLADSSGVYIETYGNVAKTRVGHTAGNPGTYTLNTKHVYYGNGPTYNSPYNNPLQFTELSY